MSVTVPWLLLGMERPSQYLVVARSRSGGRTGSRYAKPWRVSPVELNILGPVAMSGPNGPVTLRGHVQPVLLALLGLRANHVVSTAELGTGLWGDNPPATALKTTHGHVARLRRELELA